MSVSCQSLFVMSLTCYVTGGHLRFSAHCLFNRMASCYSQPTKSMMSIVNSKIALSVAGCLIIIIFHLFQVQNAIFVKRDYNPSVDNASQ